MMGARGLNEDAHGRGSGVGFFRAGDSWKYALNLVTNIIFHLAVVISGRGFNTRTDL